MNKPMTRKGAMAFGAVTGFLAPRLAEGASVNLAPIFSKVNARNYAASIPTLVAEVSREADGKLVAMDGMSDGLGRPSWRPEQGRARRGSCGSWSARS